MKALVYTGPKSLVIQDRPDPIPDAGDVLIRVDSVGICGSDMHAYLGHDERRPAPLILGHEAAGTVIESRSDDIAPGNRVTVNPLVTCGRCEACKRGRDNLCSTRQIISMQPREGAFAELLSMPARNLVVVPDSIPLAHAALVEPIACGWHAGRLAEEALDMPFSDANALVIGGGAIGVGAALSLMAQGMGAVTLVEPNAARRAFLAERTHINALAEADLPADQMFDMVIDGVGIVPTRALSSARTRPGGVITHIGLGGSEGGLDVRRLTLQEIAFIGTYTYTMADFRATAAAMFAGKLGDMDWTTERPLADGGAAFADLLAGQVDAPKIVLKP